MTPLLDALRSSVVVRGIARLVRSLFRGVFGKPLAISPDIECNKKRFGNPGACFTVATGELGLNSVVMSVGIGEDVSFDLGLMAAFGLNIHAFDPTPRSLAWIRTQHLPDGLHVHPYGLANRDGDVVFHPPKNPAHVSHSAVVRHASNSPGVRCPVRRLGSLMNIIGVSRIDLLKLDIEGAEYEVLEDLAASQIRPKQILVEYHHRFPGIGVVKTRESIALLQRLGYRLFDVSPSGEEFSFIFKPSTPSPNPTQ